MSADAEDQKDDKILVEDTLVIEETTITECGGNLDKHLDPDPIREEPNKDLYIQEIKKAIEEKKDAEMNSKLEEMKKAETAAIEMIRKEEENKYNTLKKKFIWAKNGPFRAKKRLKGGFKPFSCSKCISISRLAYYDRQ